MCRGSLEEAYHSQRLEIEKLTALLAEHSSQLANAKIELAQAAFNSERSHARSYREEEEAGLRV